MRTIGVRELRQQASKYLRDVERGATIEVTDRGRPVARLVPVPKGDILADLVASGRVRPAKGDVLRIRPLPVKASVPPPSEVLRQMREHER
jgi:prevent-host-death family protein